MERDASWCARAAGSNRSRGGTCPVNPKPWVWVLLGFKMPLREGFRRVSSGFSGLLGFGIVVLGSWVEGLGFRV